jgi:hypothetical protein
MIEGRGMTSCLICDKEDDYIFENMAIIYGVKEVYETDDVSEFHNIDKSFR